MLCLTTRRSPRPAGRAILATTFLAGAAIVGSAASASAFVADAGWLNSTAPHPAHGAHHRHAPSGANVIGRGIGGLHGQLSDAAADRTSTVR